MSVKVGDKHWEQTERQRVTRDGQWEILWRCVETGAIEWRLYVRV